MDLLDLYGKNYAILAGVAARDMLLRLAEGKFYAGRRYPKLLDMMERAGMTYGVDRASLVCARNHVEVLQRLRTGVGIEDGRNRR